MFGDRASGHTDVRNPDKFVSSISCLSFLILHCASQIEIICLKKMQFYRGQMLDSEIPKSSDRECETPSQNEGNVDQGLNRPETPRSCCVLSIDTHILI